MVIFHIVVLVYQRVIDCYRGLYYPDNSGDDDGPHRHGKPFSYNLTYFMRWENWRTWYNFFLAQLLMLPEAVLWRDFMGIIGCFYRL